MQASPAHCRIATALSSQAVVLGSTVNHSNCSGFGRTHRRRRHLEAGAPEHARPPAARPTRPRPGRRARSRPRAASPCCRRRSARGLATGLPPSAPGLGNRRAGSLPWPPPGASSPSSDRALETRIGSEVCRCSAAAVRSRSSVNRPGSTAPGLLAPGASPGSTMMAWAAVWPAAAGWPVSRWPVSTKLPAATNLPAALGRGVSVPARGSGRRAAGATPPGSRGRRAGAAPPPSPAAAEQQQDDASSSSPAGGRSDVERAITRRVPRRPARGRSCAPSRARRPGSPGGAARGRGRA